MALTNRVRHLRSLATGSLLPVAVVVAIVLSACGGSDAGKSAFGESEAVEVTKDAVTVEMRNILFEPKAIKIKPGTTVTWVNKDPVVHNVRAYDSTFLSPDEMPPAATFAFRFDTPGTYRYECTFHPPNQIGVVIVEGE